MLKKKYIAAGFAACLMTASPAFAVLTPYERDCLKFTGALMAGIAPTFELIATSGFVSELASFAGKLSAMTADLAQEFKTKQAFFEDKNPGGRPYYRMPRPEKNKADTLFADVNTLAYDRTKKTLPANYATADMFDYAAVDHVKRHVEKQLLDHPGPESTVMPGFRDHRYVTARETALRSYVEAAAMRGKLKNEIVPILNQVQSVLVGNNQDYNQNVIASVTVSEAANDIAALSAKAAGLTAKVSAVSGIYAETSPLTSSKGGKLGPSTTSFDF